MEGFCTSIGIIEQGRLKVTGTIEEVTRRVQKGRRLLIELLDPDPRLDLLLKENPKSKTIRPQHSTPSCLKVMIRKASNY